MIAPALYAPLAVEDMTFTIAGVVITVDALLALEMFAPYCSDTRYRYLVPGERPESSKLVEPLASSCTRVHVVSSVERSMRITDSWSPLVRLHVRCAAVLPTALAARLAGA